MKTISILLIIVIINTLGCTNTKNDRSVKVGDVKFNTVIAYDSADNMWARTTADINSDGILDIIVTNNNAHGGWLGWFETSKEMDNWQLHIIADSTKMGSTFAQGDIATGDFNNDGKSDIVAIVHKGEWRAGNQPSDIYWFENPIWTPHFIGQAPAFVKDIVVADFNNNGNSEIAVITFENNSLQIFARQKNQWGEILNMTIPNLHEGMDAGDIDGDDYIDIAVNGYWLKSPGENLALPWELHNINSKWNSQTGNWERNASKVACADINKDGRSEVFISHSESTGYPVAYYQLTDIVNYQWTEIVIDSIDGCHTLNVFDFDGDGNMDILAGQNLMRWNNAIAPLNLYINSGDHKNFNKVNISNGGCYNCTGVDFKGNGKYDIMRMAGHSSKELEVLIAQ